MDPLQRLLLEVGYEAFENGRRMPIRIKLQRLTVLQRAFP